MLGASEKLKRNILYGNAFVYLFQTHFFEILRERGPCPFSFKCIFQCFKINHIVYTHFSHVMKSVVILTVRRLTEHLKTAVVGREVYYSEST